MSSCAVDVEVMPEARWRTFRTLVAASAAASAGAWLLGWVLGPEAPVGIAALLAGTCAAALVHAFDRPPVGRLAWDGALWHWQPADGAPQRGDVRLMVDLDGWLLLRFRSPRAVVWLPVARGRSALAWAALRGALHAPRPGAGPAVEPAAR